MPNDFLEKTLEDIIFENKSTICEKGFPVFWSKVFRQVILPSGRKIDMLSFSIKDGNLNFVVYELKREYINIDAICQAYNYYEELKAILEGNFLSTSGAIIMVGRRYDNLPILKALTVPISIYTYDYQINGISFLKAAAAISNYTKNDNFSMGVWAFGADMLHFPEGQPATVNFQEIYARWAAKDTDWIKRLKSEKEKAMRVQRLLPAPEPVKLIEDAPIRVPIRTIIFPEQPQWTSEFSNELTYNDIFEDIEIDISDYEPELEGDHSDLEPETIENWVQQEDFFLMQKIDPIKQVEEFLLKLQ